MQTPLVFAHIGDLHINEAREQNYFDFLAIVAQLEVECSRRLDFVYLPGDVADHALEKQYQFVATALKMLSKPAYIIAGDHDMEDGSLSLFYRLLPARQMPYKEVIKSINCYFLDVCGNGKGGPDFRLGNEQLRWFANELQNDSNTSVLFMHTYPDDLADEEEKKELIRLIAEHNIALVDMGHTHYNELANDGNTIYAATRSTGQIEEGAVGYSLISIDNGVVSWRFRNLADAFPFVLITHPADYRLWRGANGEPETTVTVRAIVFGARHVKRVQCICNNAEPVLMKPEEDGTWSTQINIDTQIISTLTVEAVDDIGHPGSHTIQTGKPAETTKARNGSDADRIGAWVENGIPGTQLGPNRNAKPLHELRKQGKLPE